MRNCVGFWNLTKKARPGEIRKMIQLYEERAVDVGFKFLIRNPSIIHSIEVQLVCTVPKLKMTDFVLRLWSYSSTNAVVAAPDPTTIQPVASFTTDSSFHPDIDHPAPIQNIFDHQMLPPMSIAIPNLTPIRMDEQQQAAPRPGPASITEFAVPPVALPPDSIQQPVVRCMAFNMVLLS